jgi:protein TonB
MGNLILKLQGPAARWVRSSDGSSDASRRGARAEYPYSRSSAAVALHNTFEEPQATPQSGPQSVPQPLPQSVPQPTIQTGPQPTTQTGPQPLSTRGRAVLVPRSNPMFLSLDQRINSRSRSTTVVSVFAHIGIVAFILWAAMAIHTPVVDSSLAKVAPIQFTLYDPPPPPVMPVVKVRGGGGGGGAHQLVAPTRGSLPKIVLKTPIIPLEAPKIVAPKLLIQPAVAIRMPDAQMPKLGVPQTQQVAMASQGGGSANGFGFGLGGGVGSGHGTGQGPGSDRGYGGGVMSVGGGVSAPEVIHSVQPQFTAEARSQNYQGVVAVQLIVDSQGFPQDVRVVRHLGMGLDEEAIAAVKQYRFRPAAYEGRSVSVQMVIDVDFRLD